MSLRLRLVLLTLILVSLVAVVLSALQMQALVDSLSQDTVSRAELAGRQTSAFLIDQIRVHAAEYPVAETTQGTVDQWGLIVSTDADLPIFLSSVTQISDAFLEINVATKNGKILASNTPGAQGSLLHRRELFTTWSQLPWYHRIYDLLSRRPDWEFSPRPIGIAEADETVLQIQIVMSSLLARNSLLPPLQRLATILALALLLSLIVTLFATHSALRPLQRIERTIDRITQGNFRAGESDGHLAKEFQAVETKLDLLGQQMIGAREQTPTPRNLDVLMERVASQLDVATRLSAISRLSSGVAHEIKNPLNAILLRLDLLKVRLGESDEEVMHELDVLSKEVLRLNRVVTTFLDFSRPVEVHFEDLDLGALVRDVAELVRPQATVGKIAVMCEVPAQPAMMRGDPDLLKQAVLNLVTNAVEAMSPNEGILRVSVTKSADNWVLEVADTGPGIPPALRDKVFQLYFTSKAKGSGIGLAMTYRAAQLHNGTISFSSESGRGTTFRLELPALVAQV